jgi:hypothetical protein
VITPIGEGIASWVAANPGLATAITVIGAGLAGLVVALPIIAGIITAIGTIGTAIGALTTAFPVLAGLGTVFAILAPPIGIAAAAIIGFAALAFVVVKNWQPISGFFSRLWQGVIQTVARVGPTLLGLLLPIPAQIIRLFTGAGIGQRIITSIIDGLKARAGALFSWIGGAVSRINSMVGGGGATVPAAPAAPPVSPANNIRPIPGRAVGGQVRAGFPYIVGERRRELFVPGFDGAIIPRIARPLTAGALAGLLSVAPPAAAAGSARALPALAPAPARASAAAPAAAITINAPITITAAGGDAMEIRRQVDDALQDLVRQMESAYRTLLND